MITNIKYEAVADRISNMEVRRSNGAGKGFRDVRSRERLSNSGRQLIL